jgi:hypothetical protein
MKKLFIILSLIYSHLAFSGSYEFYESDIQELLNSIREKAEKQNHGVSQLDFNHIRSVLIFQAGLCLKARVNFSNKSSWLTP